jgi:hypothetical protein
MRTVPSSSAWISAVGSAPVDTNRSQRAAARRSRLVQPLQTSAPVDAIDFLLRQHDLVEEGLAHALRSRGGERRRAFEQAADLLLAHVTVEEEIFFPAIRAEKLEAKLRETLEEHLSLKRIVADLLAMDPDDPVFEAKLKVLSEQSDHHHDEEEKDVFPVVHKTHDHKWLVAIGTAMVEREAMLLSKAGTRNLAAEQTEHAARLSR